MQPSWLQALVFESSAVANNKKILDDTKAKLATEQNLVFSMMKANWALCSHANKRGYTEMDGSYGWKCPTCGESL
jgi:PHP family Zn ribbon phosphoesterase